MSIPVPIRCSVTICRTGSLGHVGQRPTAGFSAGPTLGRHDGQIVWVDVGVLAQQRTAIGDQAVPVCARQWRHSRRGRETTWRPPTCMCTWGCTSSTDCVGSRMLTAPTRLSCSGDQIDAGIRQANHVEQQRIEVLALLVTVVLVVLTAFNVPGCLARRRYRCRRPRPSDCQSRRRVSLRGLRSASTRLRGDRFADRLALTRRPSARVVSTALSLTGRFGATG